MGKKFSKEKIQNICKENGLELLSDYHGLNKYIKVKCLKCGHEYETKAIVIYNGHGCPKCARVETISQEEAEKRFLKQGLKLLDKYINNRTKVLARCLKCGYEWKVFPYSIFNGRSCPKCVIKNRRFTHEYVKQKFKEKGFEPLEKYVNVRTKILTKCLTCGHEWKVLPKMIMDGRQGCPICSRKNRKRTKKLSLDTIKERYLKRGFELLEKYTDIHKKHKTKCLTCGYIWNTRPGDIFSGKAGCPQCAKKVPKWELELIDMLKNLGFDNIIHHYKFNGNKEIDIYLPDHNLGLELNGLYWHSWGPNIKNNFKNNKSLAKWHLYNKKMLALEKGIDIIFIFEHEYYNKQFFNKFINFFLAKCQKFEKTIYARKCQFKEIDNETAFDFYDKYHILGRPVHSHHFGLVYDGEIVSLISMRKEKNEWIITRYCNRPKYQILGGFQKLLKNSLKYLKLDPEIDNIVTFIDLRFVNPHNNVFVRNGFIKVGDVEPRYFYWKEDPENGYFEIIERRQAQKPRLQKILSNFNPDLTEEQNMFINGFLKCYDAGKIKLKFKTV